LSGITLLPGLDRRSAVPWVMTKGAYTLSDITWPMVRLYCPQCHRHAQFKRSTLLDRFGPDKVMPSMLADLKPCGIGQRVRAAVSAPVLDCDDRPGASRSHQQGWIAGKLASLEPKCPVRLIVSVPVVLAFDVARGTLVLPGWNGVGTPGERSRKHQRGGS
jgi:hypothetical protein